MIDHGLEYDWSARGIDRAPPATDEVFVRRMHLDLLGRIASVREARDFLSDGSKRKRAEWIRRLVDSPEHARHMARYWRSAWIPEAETQPFQELSESLDPWLASQLRLGTGYDKIVRELLVASTSKTAALAAMQPRGASTTLPRNSLSASLSAPPVFAAANTNSPGNLAASTARAFLGINIGCAQCHDHPFSQWSREQFWQLAAFFAAPQREPKNGRPDANSNRLERTGFLAPRLAVAETDRVVQARFLDGQRPNWPDNMSADEGRRQLAEWIVDADNAYFARNAVNRLWAKFFGRGLVEPLDDLTDVNHSPHSELLGQLAAGFIQNDFDLRVLTKAIVSSRAYQLSSTANHPRGTRSTSDEATRSFASMPVRLLSGGQLYDSLRLAAGHPPERNDLNRQDHLVERERFIKQFFVRHPTSAQRSIPQTLTLFNGRPVNQFTSPNRSPTLKALIEAPFLDEDGRLETLFLATLNRRPTTAEKRLFGNFARSLESRQSSGTEHVSAEAMSDLLWVLLQSTEFNTIR
jgi:hypothetical protein